MNALSDTVKRLVVQLAIVRRELREAGFGPPAAKEAATLSPEEQLHARNIHPEILEVAGQLFKDGHYARAVEEAFKALNNYVKDRTRLTDEDGAALMKRAFSPSRPLLKINDLKSKSKKDEQLGYMDIYAGGMTGVRNPRAHEHRLKDDVQTALDLLSLAGHLYQKAEKAVHSRKKRGGGQA